MIELVTLIGNVCVCGIFRKGIEKLCVWLCLSVRELRCADVVMMI